MSAMTSASVMSASAWALSADCLLYRIDRHLLGDPIRHRPAHDLAREGVDDGREVEPSLTCRYVGDVAYPEPVALIGGEDALDQVQAGISRLDPLLDTVLSGRALGDKSQPPHDAQHALLAHEDAGSAKLSVDAPVAVSCMMALEDILHESL